MFRYYNNKYQKILKQQKWNSAAMEDNRKVMRYKAILNVSTLQQQIYGKFLKM